MADAEPCYVLLGTSVEMLRLRGCGGTRNGRLATYRLTAVCVLRVYVFLFGLVCVCLFARALERVLWNSRVLRACVYVVCECGRELISGLVTNDLSRR